MSRWRAFVPGRLEVFGKHTDYAGGRSLVTAVPRGFTVSMTPAEDGLIVVDISGGNSGTPRQRAEFSVAGHGPSEGWCRYPLTAIRRIATNFPDAELSAYIELSSDLPQAAGLSSSSALIVAIAEALLARAGIEDMPGWRKAIRGLEERAAYFGCVENGADFGTLVGGAGVGTHGGSEDHAAILMSRTGYLQQFSFSPLRRDRSIRMPDGWTFAVATTGVAARKTGEARDDYNRAAASAAAIVSAWRERHPGDGRTLGELTRANGPDDSMLADLELSASLRARLEHFIAEDTRVPEAATALECGDFARVGELADASQRDAERLLGNQVKATTDLVRLAREVGARAASGFGAGWGGSVWALVPTEDADAFLAEWLRIYRAYYPSLMSEGFISPPSAGMARVDDNAT